MERRKFLIGAGSLAAAGAAGLGTGAFTSVSAERTVTVNVTGDESAYLQMDQGTGSPNNQYAEFTDDSTITVNLDNSDNGGGTGLNKNAETDIADIFRIKNAGTQPVFVYIDPASVSPDRVTADPDGDGNPEYADEGGIYLDPQAQELPNGEYTGMSFTGIYGQTNSGSPAGGFASGGPYDNEDLTLGVGQTLNFGLVANVQDIDYTADVTMDIVADADLAADLS